MLVFCPQCGLLLTLKAGGRQHEFTCLTCDYVYAVTRTVRSRTYPRLKETDDVLSDATMWENADSTDEKCPKCENGRAYFMQMQTRSADEPMTNFYRCCNKECAYRWKE